ncbi:hypothetical protein [Haloechinothrix alba]|nr:hypothetical protein [Haloechinothrix alba]
MATYPDAGGAGRMNPFQAALGIAAIVGMVVGLLVVYISEPGPYGTFGPGQLAGIALVSSGLAVAAVSALLCVPHLLTQDTRERPKKSQQNVTDGSER